MSDALVLFEEYRPLNIDEQRISRMMANRTFRSDLAHYVETRPELVGRRNAKRLLETGAAVVYSAEVQISLEELASSTQDAAVFAPLRKLGDFALGESVYYTMPVKYAHISKHEIIGQEDGDLIVDIETDHILRINPRSPAIIPEVDYDYFWAMRKDGRSDIQVHKPYIEATAAALGTEPGQRSRHRFHRKLGGVAHTDRSTLLKNVDSHGPIIRFKDETRLRNLDITDTVETDLLS